MSKRINLSRGLTTVVDDEDFDFLSQWKWFAHIDGGTGAPYAKRQVWCGTKEQRGVLMHCQLVGLSGVDHINGDTLDNRKCNLRPATRSQNAMNSSKGKRRNTSSRFKGVSKKATRWIAQITVDKKRKQIGSFSTEEEAARAYDRHAKNHYKDFARLNFPDEAKP